MRAIGTTTNKKKQLLTIGQFILGPFLAYTLALFSKSLGWAL